MQRGLSSRSDSLGDEISSIAVREEPVVAVFITDIQHDENNCGKSTGKAQDVDDRVCAIADEVAERRHEVVVEHVSRLRRADEPSVQHVHDAVGVFCVRFRVSHHDDGGAG